MLPSFNFVEFSIAFILGLSLPILVIVGLLKPLLNIRWRFLALLTFSLLIQLYSFTYLSQWQTPILLLSAASFVAISCFWLIAERIQTTATYIAKWLVGSSLFVFMLALANFAAVDIYPLWLAYLAITTICAISVQITSTVKEQFFRVMALWLVMAAYGSSLYFWLNTQVAVVWVISLSVLSYLLAVINGCWGVVQSVKGKVAELKLTLDDNQIVEKKPAIHLDPVTNLPTYQQGLERLQRLMNKQPANDVVAIVFKPLNFDQVNKVLGHQNSDILLLQLAYNLQKCLSENELVLNFSDEVSSVKISRLQGLDFLVILQPSLSNHPVKIVVEDLCKQLIKSVPQAMSFKSFSLNFELAFGIAMLDKSHQSAEVLIAQASDALLEAERSDQTVRYFDSQSTLYTEQQLAKMEKLRQDIVDEKLVWLAQPQISLLDKKIKGFEISIDWKTGQGKRLTSKEFDDIAEFSGEIYRLTKQMIKQAFQLLSLIHQNGIQQYVAINLSSKDLLEPDLVDYVESQAEQVNIPLHYLVIELNEQVLLTSAFRARMMVDQLKALGIKIAIDHFSGSYESLRYLRRTSIQQVKIDCALLNADDQAKSEKTIVNALINLIRKMHIPVVATGVHNADIEKSYLSIGGDVAQGNLIHQGMKIDEVEAWLTLWQAQVGGI